MFQLSSQSWCVAVPGAVPWPYREPGKPLLFSPSQCFKKSTLGGGFCYALKFPLLAGKTNLVSPLEVGCMFACRAAAPGIGVETRETHQQEVFRGFRSWSTAVTSTVLILGLSSRLVTWFQVQLFPLQGCSAECASTAKAGGPPWASKALG